jgi:hypothetical protein
VFNGGKLNNRGIETMLGYSLIQSGTTSWITRATFTKYTNEVVDLNGLPAFFPAQSGFGNLGRTRIEVGQPITQLVGFELNDDGTRGTTLVQLGNTNPDFRMGFVNDITWKAVSFNMVLDWQSGSDIINLTRYLQDDARTSADWGTPEGVARYKGYLSGSIQPYIEDGSFVKLREINLGVDVPQRLFGQLLRTGVESMRLSISGRNLWMWTNYSGLDPEVANFGAAAVRNNLDIGAYPPSRSFFFNVTLGF